MNSEYISVLIEIFSQALLDKPHPNQPIVWAQIRDDWNNRGLTEADFRSVVKKMVADGTLEENKGQYFLTDLAVTQNLITPPTLSEIEDRILNEFKVNGCDVGGKLKSNDIKSTMLHEGFIESDYDKGYKSLLGQNKLTQFDDYLMLTVIGFATL